MERKDLEIANALFRGFFVFIFFKHGELGEVVKAATARGMGMRRSR
jgi:hypothetical protein